MKSFSFKLNHKDGSTVEITVKSDNEKNAKYIFEKIKRSFEVEDSTNSYEDVFGSYFNKLFNGDKE
jgi:hypothetical protein